MWKAAAAIFCALLFWQAAPAGRAGALPNATGSVKFAVIGDSGTGEPGQYQIGEQMARARQEFPFDLVLMVGDNFYGSQRAADARTAKFDAPYKALLDAGVVFQAALGNHDEPDSVQYPPLNMNGRRYYTFTRADVRFLVLDTNALDARQLEWAERTLQAARERWKVGYFHHPLYSSAARHGAAIDLRVRLEPLLVRYGVHVVFSGHDHIYERLLPQQGIVYFVCGSGGQLRRGNLARSAITAAGFDQDLAFTLVEIGADAIHFETRSRTGATVDSGAIVRGRAGT